MSIKGEKVKITQLQNPSQFFFFFHENPKCNLAKTREKDLQTVLPAQIPDDGFSPKVGDICGFYQQRSKKWVKVRIDHIEARHGVDLVVLWCIDYGVSLCTDNFRRFTAIPREFQEDCGLISSGSLNILPAEMKFDFNTCETNLQETSDWSPKAVEIATNFVKFAKKLKFHVTSEHGDFQYGDLEAINEEGQSFSLRKMLLDKKMAVAPEEGSHKMDSQEGIHKTLKRLKTREIDRWNDNARTGGIMNTFDEDEPVLELPDVTAGVTDVEPQAPSAMMQAIENSTAPPTSKPAPPSPDHSNAIIEAILKSHRGGKKSDVSPVAGFSSSEATTNRSVPSCDFEEIVKALERSMSAKSRADSHAPPSSPQQDLPVSNEAGAALKSTEQSSTLSQKGATGPDLPLPVPMKSVKYTSAPEELNEIVRSQNAVWSSLGRIFIHGKYLTDPIEAVSDAVFTKEIHEGMYKMEMRSLYRTQAHSWPNILAYNSTVIINGENSGKTFSYLPALLTSLLFDLDPTTQIIQGPVAVLLVASSREVELIGKYCANLVPREQLTVVKAFGNFNCENKQVALLNGCDLLITTPPCFSRLAQGNVIKMFNKERIKYLIFDGLDQMHEKFEQDIRTIIKTCTMGEEHREKNPQLIITSTSWMKYIESYTKLIFNPLIIIGSFVEAALYTKCTFSIIKSTINGKMEKLMKHIDRNLWQRRKTAIVFQDSSELAWVHHEFKSTSIDCLVVNERDGKESTDSVIDSWTHKESGRMSVLLIADSSLAETNIDCVKELIHFSLPPSWSRFSKRFAAMRGSFKDFASGKSSEQLFTMILLDEKNQQEIPRLIEFVKSRRVLSKIPQEISDLVQKIIDDREEQKHDEVYLNIQPICSNVLQFGQCAKFWSCKKRHVFTDIERPLNIPCDGMVKFELVGIRNPTQYTVKILEYLPANEKRWISCQQKNSKIEESLEGLQTQMAELNLIQVNAKTNDLCVVFCPKKVKWCRCRVIQKQYISDTKFKAIVHLIDYGYKMLVKPTDLKAMPDSLKLLDPLVTELRILNLVPYDNDESWDHETTTLIEKHISQQRNEIACGYLIAKIEFAIQNVIFAQTFEMRISISAEMNIIKYALKNDLLKKNFCMKDSTVAEKLKELMTRAGLYVPQEEITANAAPSSPVAKKVECEETGKPRWKHLTNGSEHQVTVKYFENPYSFYIVVDATGKHELQGMMKSVAECTTRIPMETPQEGDFCLIIREDQICQRAVISTPSGDDEIFNAFLLDAGEQIKCSKDEIFQMPPAVMNKPSFQAVKCRLLGVKPKFELNEWLPKPIKVIKQCFTEYCCDKLVRMRVIEKKLDMYGVVLYHPETGERFDRLLVAENIVVAANQKAELVEAHEVSEARSQEDAIDQNELEEEVMRLLASEEQGACTIGTDECLRISNLPPTTRLIPIEEPTEAQSEDKERVKKPVEVKESVNTTTLSYIHPHPKIEWRQDDELVFLHIAAVDSVDYALEASDSSLQIYIKYESSYELTLIDLYGITDLGYFSHEKAGVNIIVRLLKTVRDTWPRLTRDDDHNRFINFSIEGIPNYIGFEESEKAVFRPGGMSGDDETENDWEMSDTEDLPV